VVVMSAITGANVVWGDALVRGDTAALASLYADDAVLMAPEGDLAGKSAIIPALLSGRRVGRDTLHATSTESDYLDVAGDKAYETGTLTYTMVSPRGARREVKVRYVSFWQLAADRWLLRRTLRPLP
jgi:ketosteroid isomerase-like protein